MDLVLALSTASTALIVATVGLVGALIGGAASFAGTWWERRTERRQTAADGARVVCASVLDAMSSHLQVCLEPEFDLDRRRISYVRVIHAVTMLGLYPDIGRALQSEILALESTAGELSMWRADDAEDVQDPIDVGAKAGIVIGSFARGAGSYIDSLG